MITIYTDGSARGNPGPGGWGAVVIGEVQTTELGGREAHTTNNRMELLSVIIGLEMLKTENCDVTVFSDSRYVVDSVEKKWIDGWVKRGWKKVKNPDLWKRFQAVAINHNVKFKWIRGHNGHPMNERCDELAVAASWGKNLQADVWYEANKDNEDLFGV